MPLKASILPLQSQRKICNLYPVETEVQSVADANGTKQQLHFRKVAYMVNASSFQDISS